MMAEYRLKHFYTTIDTDTLTWVLMSWTLFLQKVTLDTVSSVITSRQPVTNTLLGLCCMLLGSLTLRRFKPGIDWQDILQYLIISRQSEIWYPTLSSKGKDVVQAWCSKQAGDVDDYGEMELYNWTDFCSCLWSDRPCITVSLEFSFVGSKMKTGTKLPYQIKKCGLI